MTAWTWTLAALGAGVLGWIGPQVIARLPASPDADPETASYRDIADVPRLSVWLAAGAVALVTIVSLGVPDHLIPAWVVVCGAGMWLAYIDWRTNLLPTRIVWPTYAVTVAVVGIEAWAMADVKILMRGMVASAIAFAVFWLVWWVAGLWRPGSFGFGDVRLAAPL
ncbi:MAG TPA: prepilin peptidase, partial [Aeromicrobium sp.]|nr:prepilin peptidase [Aeromicrobium sp.]